MQNISNALSTTNSIAPVADNQSNNSLLARCKTCGITGDNKVLVFHKYNCPQKEIPCNNCLKKFTIQQIPTHINICKEVEVKYFFIQSDTFSTFMIKKSVLSSIELAEEILNNNDYTHDDEKIKIYKQTVISYNELIAKFNSTSAKSSFVHYGLISYDEYKKIIDENIKLEKNQPLNNSSEDEITKNYLQKTIKYKIYDLPEVEITVEELLHIKAAEIRVANNNAIPNSSEDELLFYQKAVTIYKQLVLNLKANQDKKNREFDEWMSTLSRVRKGEIPLRTYSIQDKVKIKIPEKPLVTTGFQLHLANDATLPFRNISGKLFSFLSVDKEKDSVLHTFQPGWNHFPDRMPYDITVKINSTPNYHTDEDIGIYLLLTKSTMNFMSKSHSADTQYILAVSYIDKDDYKNFLFGISFTTKELVENLQCTDTQDQTTKFGYLNRPKKMEQLNRFFNDDGIGTEHINKYGCDSIFGIEFYMVVPQS